MATKHKATLDVECWKEHTCADCGSIFRYLFIRKQTGEGPTPGAAREAARQAMMAATANEVELQPCPACGLYQPDMVGDAQATAHGCLLIVLAIFLAIVTTVAILVSFDVFGFPLYLLTWIAVGLCLLGALGHLLYALRNLNRDLEANRRKAEVAVQKQTLRLEKSGPLEQPLPWTHPRPLGAAHLIALLLLFVGIGILPSAEMVRLLGGWPMNRHCEPMVVGPGDKPAVYLPDSVTSLKGLWNGTADVEVLNAEELGLADPRLPASGKQDTWGGIIVGKRVRARETPLWAQVAIPDRTDLAGKTVQLRINLAVRFPAPHGARGFQEEQRAFEHTTAVQLAAPRAGFMYRLLWWGGGAAGGVLVLLAGFWLYRLGHRLKREALPSRVVPISDDEVPEVLPAQ